MNLNEFCQEINDLLGLQAASINPETNITELPEWSSLTFMALIAMVDEEYSVTLVPSVILSASSVTEIYDAIVYQKSVAKAA